MKGVQRRIDLVVEDVGNDPDDVFRPEVHRWRGGCQGDGGVRRRRIDRLDPSITPVNISQLYELKLK